MLRRSTILVLILLLSAAAACARGRSYPLTGQVLAVDPARQEITVKHEDIRGFMPAMTMPFKVRDTADFQGRKPGELITATLVVEESTGYLQDIRSTGEAPLPPEASRDLVLRMIEPGAAVPDAELVDSTGARRRISDWRGKTLAVTFVYTRCPLPDFCPLMDRNFLAVQRLLEADPALGSRVHLLSVSFDPDYDKPEILEAHARRIGVRPALWSYLTGTREAVDGFAAAFGVSVMRDDKPMAEILHNLRTAVIDRQGVLVTVLGGNDWKPEALFDAIRAADARR